MNSSRSRAEAPTRPSSLRACRDSSALCSARSSAWICAPSNCASSSIFSTSGASITRGSGSSAHKVPNTLPSSRRIGTDT